jgi:hypothetical protein
MSDSSALPEFIRKAIRMSGVQLASGFDRLFIFEFDALETHRAFVAKHFAATTKEFEERFASEMKAVPRDERDELRDLWIDEYETTVEILPRVQWNAQLLVAYSTFESILQSLCNIVEKRCKLPISFKELGGAGIQRAADYLRKMAGVRSPFETPEWQRALLLGELRNKIAHTNGVVELQPQNKKSLYFRAGKVEHLRFAEGSKADEALLVLNAEFVEAALIVLRKVLLDVANYELFPEGTEV